jgi:hypothetical protein
MRGAIPPLWHDKCRGALSTGYVFMVWYLVKQRQLYLYLTLLRITFHNNYTLIITSHWGHWKWCYSVLH